MNVEYTGRHYEVTPPIRKAVETGLSKIRKILGDKFETKVILTAGKAPAQGRDHHQSAATGRLSGWRRRRTWRRRSTKRWSISRRKP